MLSAVARRDVRLRLRNDRRGAVLILAALFMIIMLGCVAMAIDIGYLCVARSQAQNTADAAAMAAAWSLIDERRLKGLGDLEELEADARDVAMVYAAANRICGDAPKLDRNATNQPDADLVFGHVDGDGELSVDWEDASSYNTVTVRVRRSQQLNGPVTLFLAPLLGVGSVDIQAEATATFRNDISGFRSGRNIMPFVIHIDEWTNLLEQGGTDNWSVDPQTGEVTAGSDGIPEIALYPNTLGGGNFGTLQIGDATLGTADLVNQIINGLSDADITEMGGDISLGPHNGNPGVSSGLALGMAKIVGKRRTIFLYDDFTPSGANAVFNTVGFAGVRVVNCRLTGLAKDSCIVLQPAVIVDKSAIAGGGPSCSVFQPAILTY